MTELEWMEIFGDNLKSYMDEYGYTQKQLSEATGVPESCISSYVNRRTLPNVKSLMNMAYELGVELNDFIDFGERIQ